MYSEGVYIEPNQDHFKYEFSCQVTCLESVDNTLSPMQKLALAVIKESIDFINDVPFVVKTPLIEQYNELKDFIFNPYDLKIYYDILNKPYWEWLHMYLPLAREKYYELEKKLDL